MPKVSVILCAYNAERFFSLAVQSVLDQTFTDFELIVIDDGSTDRTPAISDDFARRDSRVRVIHQSNTKHVIANRNGIDVARAPLLARMDADDLCKPDRLALQVAFMDAHPDVVLLGGAYELIDEYGRLLTTIRQPADDATLQAIALGGQTPICHPLSMFRKDAYYRVGGYRPEYVAADDLDLWLRLGEVGKIACLPDVLLQYRQHAGSISEQKQTLSINEQREICRQACERRGVTGQYPFKGDTPWRATGDKASKLKQVVKYGWWAFNSGQRRTARAYGFRALRMNPLAGDGYRLIYASFKPRGNKTADVHV